MILDVIGGDYTNRNLACIANQGTIIQVGLMGGGSTEIDLGKILRARIRLIGTVLQAERHGLRLWVARPREAHRQRHPVGIGTGEERPLRVDQSYGA